MWLIPFSKQPGKLADYMRRTADGKTCDIFHPTTLGGIRGVLLIADMIPMLECYIKEPYTIGDKPVIYKDTSDIRIINQKTHKVLALLRRGVKFTKTQPDVFSIEKQLLNRDK